MCCDVMLFQLWLSSVVWLQYKLYLRAHLKCFVYLYERGYPGAGSKKERHKHIIQNLILTRTQLKKKKKTPKTRCM